MALEHQLDTPLAEAVRAAGSQSAFGRLIRRGQSTINDWLRDDRLLPAENVLVVERATGVSKERLRPDLYPPTHPHRRGTTTMVDRGQHKLFAADVEQ